MKAKVFMDIHVLQTVPPSCLNRDDTGAPKTAIYGGVTRARVSSQSWKKATRDDFREGLPVDELSYRTKQVLQMVVAEVIGLSPELDEELVTEKVADYLVAVGIMKKEKAQTVKKGGKKVKDSIEEVDEEETDKQKTMFFITTRQVKAFAVKALALIQSGEDVTTKDKKDLKEALRTGSGVEIELFGRMAASDPDLNIDACVQVADALSTHEVENEINFFTAVDDKNSLGAGHIGESEFNSSTLYRYASVAVHDLDTKLNDRARAALIAKEFVYSFISSLPTGKQTSHAHNTVPSAIYVTFRTDRPISLVPAFEASITEEGSGYMKMSADALVEYANDLYEDFFPEPAKGFTVGKLLEGLGENTQRVSLDALYKEIENYIYSLD